MKKKLVMTCKTLVDTAQSNCVNLAGVGCFGLEKLLEGDTILGCLPTSHAHAVRLQRFADGGVSKDIVRVCGFYEPNTVRAVKKKG